MSVEVERKFICTDETLKVLENTGVCVGQREFHDQYFDTTDFDLTLQDFWLRKRKGCWELKCPLTVSKADKANGGQSKAEALCTRYREITDLTEIQQRVSEVLKDRGSLQPAKKAKKGKTEEVVDSQSRTLTTEDGLKTLDDEIWLCSMNVKCFAEFTTVRRSFTLEEDGVQVDLDQADFGYSVGEIEVLVTDREDVQSALEKIENAAQKLGLTGNRKIPGKMDVYLQRYLPKHYEALLKAHIL